MDAFVSTRKRKRILSIILIGSLSFLFCVKDFPESPLESDAALLLANVDGVQGSFSAASPDSLGNLALWFKADSLSQADGSPVSNWVDSSGLGNDALQLTAAMQPLYRTNVLNSMPVLDFDGVDDELVSTDVDFETYTFIIVARHTIPFGGFDYRMELLSKMQGGRCTTVYFEWQSDGSSYIANRNSLDGSTEFFIRSSANEGQFYLIAATYDGIASHLFIDGELVKSSAINAGTIVDHNFAFRIVRKNAANHIFRGDIAEVIMYREALTDLQRVKVECNLSLKYALPVSQTCVP